MQLGVATLLSDVGKQDVAFFLLLHLLLLLKRLQGTEHEGATIKTPGGGTVQLGAGYPVRNLCRVVMASWGASQV